MCACACMGVHVWPRHQDAAQITGMHTRFMFKTNFNLNHSGCRGRGARTLDTCAHVYAGASSVWAVEFLGQTKFKNNLRLSLQARPGCCLKLRPPQTLRAVTPLAHMQHSDEAYFVPDTLARSLGSLARTGKGVDARSLARSLSRSDRQKGCSCRPRRPGPVQALATESRPVRGCAAPGPARRAALGLRRGFESPDLDRPGRQLHQQGLREARLGYRDGSPPKRPGTQVRTTKAGTNESGE